MITIDFLFSIVLIFGMTTLMFILAITLSVASLTQYITFATARNYVASHIDEATQQKQGQAKYHELVSNPVFQPFYKNGWYTIDADATIADHTKIFPAYEQAAEGQNNFVGAGTNFVAKVLDYKIPFFGSTVTDGSGGSGFKAYLGSYIGREPTEKECEDFSAARYGAIRKLDPSYSTAPNSGYFSMTDDGC